MADWIDRSLPMIARRCTEPYVNGGAMTAKT